MEKKIIRILEPSVAMCFVVMLIFAGVTFLFDELILAAVEAGIVLILFVYHIMLTKKRKKAPITAVYNMLKTNCKLC